LKLADGNRGAIEKFNLKCRSYVGTTTMDPELSLVTANIALVSTSIFNLMLIVQADKGKVVYDPFAGTGGFLFTSSYFGAYTLGENICFFKNNADFC
jgi:tRNA (guanine10-N2)-methyltransferase